MKTPYDLCREMHMGYLCFVFPKTPWLRDNPGGHNSCPLSNCPEPQGSVCGVAVRIATAILVHKFTCICTIQVRHSSGVAPGRIRSPRAGLTEHSRNSLRFDLCGSATRTHHYLANGNIWGGKARLYALQFQLSPLTLVAL